jgi:hypothetical protein
MTLNEFKAWLEGFSEAFTDGVPNADQWAKVQAKLADVKLVVAVEQRKVAGFEDVFSQQPRVKFVADEINPALVPKVTS